jgi:hypothetical protein
VKFLTLTRYPRIFRILLAGGLLAPLMGGCPIDTDKLATDATQAILTSITNSLVEALSKYLATN